MIFQPASNIQVPFMQPQFRRGRVSGGVLLPSLIDYDPDLLALSDADPISTMPNTGTGGSGYDGTTTGGGPTTRPSYQTNEFGSLPGIFFDPSGVPQKFDIGDLSALSEATVFIVVKVMASNGMWTLGTGSGTYYPYSGDGKIYDDFGSTTRKDAIVPGISLSGAHLYCVRTKAGEWTARINGVQVYTTGTNTVGFPSACQLGYNTSSGTWQGVVGRFKLFNSGLSDGDRDATEAALMSLYGI